MSGMLVKVLWRIKAASGKRLSRHERLVHWRNPEWFRLFSVFRYRPLMTDNRSLSPVGFPPFVTGRTSNDRQ